MITTTTHTEASLLFEFLPKKRFYEKKHKASIKLLATFSLFILSLNLSIGQWNPQPNWKDSYQANGHCWCNSTFDHNLGSKTLNINGTNYGIIDVCDELQNHPLYRNEANGDPLYNDIQCGNGPVNDAADETGCPGRVDLGPGGCDEIGTTFDMAWLSSRTRFGGGGGAATQITGELRKWHKVTLTFDGPNTSESANPNPFTNYRLLVTFTNGNTSYLVHGFYAADGNTAETSATSGNKWRVHFAPDKTGTWTYSASFRQGTDIAINTGANAGSSAGFFDGETGTFNIAATNKNGRDHRGKGRLSYVGEHYLQYSQTGEYFVKAGADAPENTLAYEDFDDVPNRGGRRKNWNPHQQDYNAADAAAYTWKGGKGTELLGAINYLSSIGMNAFSFLTLSLHGDDENVFPYLLKVPVNTYNGYGDSNQWNNGVHHDRFDASRLDQWEKIFEYADKKGMYMHFKTLETENDNIMDGNTFGRERKIYYRELIARFGHHLALNWNISEEITLSANVIESTADWIKQIDPYDHIVVYHTYPGEKDRYNDHIGTNSDVDGASLQTGNSAYTEVRSNVLEWVSKSAAAGKKWIVALDEPGSASIGIDTDPDDIGLVRDRVVWNTLMAGGAGVEFYYGYQSGCGDLACQNHRTREDKYIDASHALDFFRDYLPFHEMVENDGLTGNNGDYVLAKPGEVYAVYLPNGGSTSINLPQGDWQVQWYNPRNGQMQSAVNPISNQLSAPDGNDWTALITKCSGFEELNGLVTIETESLDLGTTDWDNKTNAAGYTGNGYIEWTGTDHFNNPGNGLIEALITINTPGTYQIQWRNRVGNGSNTTEHNDTWLRLPDADDFFGQKAGSIVYPHGSGQTPTPNGSGSDGWFKVYMGGTLDWTWASKTSDDDGHDIFVTFDNPGTYKLQISGRSKYHQIDRIALFLPNVNNPLNTQNPQTLCNSSCTVGASCNDNNPCTTNDVFTENCDCAGTFQDIDNDAVCDANDLCPGFDDNLIGTACNDNNDCTVNDVYTTNCECLGVPPTDQTTIALEPTHDAYLQGNTLFNNDILRVENGNRISYIMFDLSAVNGTITSVDLELTVNNDPGNGTISIERGDNNNWTEVGLSNANKPNSNGLMGQFSGNYANQTTYSTSLSGITGGGLLTLILSQLDGNDVSFKSKENTGAPPRLIINLAQDNNQLSACDDGDPCTVDDEYDENCNCRGTLIDENNNNICDIDECIDIELYAFLEGALDVTTGEMTTALNTERSILPGQTPVSPLATANPAGQPYSIAPWNYSGTEGQGWTDANYTDLEVDWVMVSFRTGIASNTEIARTAALLNKDGTVNFVDRCVLVPPLSSTYIVLEHRNHVGVMSQQAVDINNGYLFYDFRAADSYRDATSVGQKQIPNGKWCLYAGDGDPNDAPSFDINGADKTIWFENNGIFDSYIGPDFNFDGDVNGKDKAIWEINNGISSRVPK